MNIANVCDRFLVLADIDADELSRWRGLIEDACLYVTSRCKKQNPSSADERRLELLGAAYAFKLYVMCGSGQLSEFTAGDVKLASSADKQVQAEKLWRELTDASPDLIDAGGFLFGRVI